MNDDIGHKMNREMGLNASLDINTHQVADELRRQHLEDAEKPKDDDEPLTP